MAYFNRHKTQSNVTDFLFSDWSKLLTHVYMIDR